MLTDRCLHVHTQRTGGTSIRSILWSLARAERLTIVGDFGERSVRAADFITVYKFGFVRNPWDWYLSRYCWHRHRRFDMGETTPSRQFALGADKGIIDATDEASCITFREFLLRGLDGDSKRGEEGGFGPSPWRLPPYFSMTRIVRDMMFSQDGERLVGFIGKLETFEADVRHLMKVIGLGDVFTGEHGVSLPQAKATVHRPYWEEYDAEMREAVAEHDAWLIGEFGYTFGIGTQ